MMVASLIELFFGELTRLVRRKRGWFVNSNQGLCGIISNNQDGLQRSGITHSRMLALVSQRSDCATPIDELDLPLRGNTRNSAWPPCKTMVAIPCPHTGRRRLAGDGW